MIDRERRRWWDLLATPCSHTASLQACVHPNEKQGGGREEGGEGGGGNDVVHRVGRSAIECSWCDRENRECESIT